jgi:hypothetical protein
MEDTTLRLIFREGLTNSYGRIFSEKKRGLSSLQGKKFPRIENTPLPHNTTKNLKQNPLERNLL